MPTLSLIENRWVRGPSEQEVGKRFAQIFAWVKWPPSNSNRIFTDFSQISVELFFYNRSRPFLEQVNGHTKWSGLVNEVFKVE